MLQKDYLCCIMYGKENLTIKGGRLINEGPETGEMGLTKFARMRKENMQEKKVAMMTEAYRRADAIEKMEEMILMPIKRR